ncbi:MAG: aspartate carbamoyltransferase catalytic subunit [Nitrospirae bacterium]|nr:aspartate carbamoyltransferase catalytic subunit [Nitrospirota bacterium]
MGLKRKDLLTLKELQKEEIELILDTAVSFKEVGSRDIKKVPTLRGKTLVNLFYEPSTRTRTSFELAAKRLSADVINISNSGSSAVKGESLLDTAKNIEAMNADMIVLRHASSGAPYILARHLKSSIINAGDGAHEHPTQGLIDLFTIREKLGKIEGVKVAIVGDITHSRVARSNIAGLTKLGAEVRVVGPPTMIPREIESSGVTVFHDLKKGISGVDVVLMLRLQLERQGKGLFPSIREYSEVYGLNKEKLKWAGPNALVMHPGPVNRDVEVSSEIADGLSSVILEQVSNGIAIRMAVIFLLSGGSPSS